MATQTISKSIPVEYVWFPERKNRSEYVARRFRPLLTGKVLDVGCDRAYLKELLKDNAPEYVGIDVGGTPDFVVNLETVARPIRGSHL